jgi:uncharacterized protein (DUF302 family)
LASVNIDPSSLPTLEVPVLRPLIGVLALAFALLTTSVHAAPEAIYKRQVTQGFDETYKALYAALEKEELWVTFEADMLARMRRFAESWGPEFNQNELTGVRAMVYCNIWWTNRIANADPDMLAMCPLHISVIGHGGKTTILMLRPSVLARGSQAEGVAATLESELIGIIERTFADGPVESAPEPAPSTP